MDYLWATLADKGWHTGFIGVEMDNYWYTAKAHQRLCAGLPDAQILDATGLVNWQRAIKTPKELAYMRKAARIVERMHRRIADRIESDLSPESLTCDGELSPAEVRLRHRYLVRIAQELQSVDPLIQLEA